MVESVDGRIDCDMVDKISGDEYYTALNSLECASQVEGKYSYQLHHCGFEDFKPNNYEPIGKEVFFKAKEAQGYEVSVDTKGTLLWDKTENNDRLCIVSEDASTEYLDYLRDLGISYIAAGKNSIILESNL